ncbi:uncharacterized protein ARMOST_10388 [Armillaria ostoyae]|uniref:Integral membrane protein n=1 Tax=Armillaria ostoyae TaxID=47428 RepID=A0A284RE98_ARMOS|nr:uncharacterized protein ARMOST_10388 [Armillaria ostoyae]
MVNQTDTQSLSDLTDADKALISQNLGSNLDSAILYSLLHGIYTGVVAVTLRNIFMTKSLPVRKAMIVVIIILHIVTTIDFGLRFSFIHSTFVNDGQSLVTKYLFSSSPGSTMAGIDATSAICSVLADATMIWCCWIVWRQCWLPILLPILLLMCATVFKIIAIHETSIAVNYSSYNVYFMIYSSSMLATTLLCTALIIYQIVTIVRAGGGGLRVYRHVIEVFIESSALYSITLIIYIGLYSRDDWTGYYITTIAAIARGIAPTLLVGRVAAGHAHPDDSWQGSITSGSIRFGTNSVGQDSQLGSITSDDLEAQAAELERDEEYEHCVRVDSEGDTSLQSVVHREGTKVQLEIPDDGHYYNENDLRGDDLEALAHPNRPRDDDLHAILVVPKD